MDKLLVYEKHTRVKGRGRYKVPDLVFSESCKMYLENSLANQEDIIKASANPTTGTILVHFNSNRNHQSIGELLERILKQANGMFDNLEQGGYDISTRPSSLPDRGSSSVCPVLSDQEKPWHTIEAENIILELASHVKNGLSVTTAKEKFLKYGHNRLPQAEQRSSMDMLIGQFTNLPVALLGVAAGFSALTGGILDALIIAGVLVLNGYIGYYMENQAEKTIQSLKSFISPSADVIRDAKVITIPAEHVVPGDILLLKPGTYVAADCRVLESFHLSIDESALTGESMPVRKKASVLDVANTPLADRENMAYMGTLVTGGEGTAIVVGTGMQTEIGRLKMLLDANKTPETPIEKQLRHMGNQLVYMGLCIGGATFVFGLIVGYGAVQMFKMSIFVAIATIPEGLPTAATLTFALGINRMKRQSILIRQLQAVETMGAIQTICFDKTGTITHNRMTVVKMFSGRRDIKVHSGECFLNDVSMQCTDYEELWMMLQITVLCNETRVSFNNDGSYKLNGSPTENALIDVAMVSGLDINKLRDSYPLKQVNHRSENRLFMSTIHETADDRILVALKGSPPEVLRLCKWEMVNGELIELTDELRQNIEIANGRMAGAALRVLGVAFKTLDAFDENNLETDLIWLGITGMTDPIRDGVKDLIQMLHIAGIETVMITGDQSPTAHAVAKHLNLSQTDHVEVLDSTTLLDINPNVMEALAKKVHVYSRVSPTHKLKIVQALQANGRTVAMTGDGINDGPALKSADIGIAMGDSGTDIAREVADVVLEKDDLETLIEALRGGRTIQANIKKSVRFFLSTNFSEIMLMTSAMVGGVGFPLNAMQLLWINIISDIFPGIALSMEHPDPEILKRPPRDPQAPLFHKKEYMEMAQESAVITANSLGAYLYGLSRYGSGSHASTIAFHSLTVSQLVHTMICRTDHRQLFSNEKLPRNYYLDLAVGGSLALQVLANLIPGLKNIMNLTPLKVSDMLVVGGSAMFSSVMNDMLKKQ
ncbi:MAG: Ca2+-transporting ATPase [Candidatus Magnetoglobus multicellularis str. Araruama]|uniref:Ca2+-transporting ATPase n=1 Tax=Candidatus Magnetoglobus multicellularis str. Araruama TaxID=890399 RepID=A0A1V1PHP6_9BACT|nr:MAG: Ca2+-transporting ATPase [Candidatus Magnetoglobus multicellularis str. Araruama]